MLRGLKEAMAQDDTLIAPKEVRKARDGRLLLTFAKSERGAEKMKEHIKTRWDDARITGGKAGSLITALHIKGMDTLVTRDEVKQALEAEMMGIQDTLVEVGPLRPMFGGCQAATVTVNRTVARVLTDKKLKIGFNQCRIEERLEVKKCYRCWAFGHEANKCKGPDRKALCSACGESGHVAAACTNRPKCLLCGVNGHRSGAGNCPKFQEALAQGKDRRAKAEERRMARGGSEEMAPSDND